MQINIVWLESAKDLHIMHKDFDIYEILLLTTAKDN